METPSPADLDCIRGDVNKGWRCLTNAMLEGNSGLDRGGEERDQDGW
jgi:hypothetical protein